jgi:peptidoglycan hydrolase CwlO-like protein
VDDLTERNDLMAYKLEQADTQVGELVRAKVADLQSKYDETSQANQQLKSLIEALEEKVSELDARAEELEAENAEIEKLLDEERKAHEATKQDGEKQVRALKKRLQLAAAGDKGALKEPAEAAAE